MRALLLILGEQALFPLLGSTVPPLESSGESESSSRLSRCVSGRRAVASCSRNPNQRFAFLKIYSRVVLEMRRSRCR